MKYLLEEVGTNKSRMRRAGDMVRMKDERLPKISETKKQRRF